MHLQSSAAFLALLASAFPHVTQAKQQGLHRKLAANDCTIMAVEALGLEEGEDPEMILINNGEVTPGHHKLNIAGAEIDDSAVHVPPGLDIASSVRQNVEKEGRRRLVDTIGNLNMLLVKVTDVGGLVYPDSATTMSDEVFGTGVDPVNLKSGLEECSWDKLTVVPGLSDSNEVATGVIEVDIGISFTNNTRGTIRNAITTAVQTKLGHSLPGPYDYVLYSVQNCYVDCGWAAYAYINSWNSVYQGVYYKRPGVLIHELGHNFGLAHSGGLDGQTYTDHTCSMGNPHYSDDAFQCFNPAKNFQLNWYNDAKITEDPRTNGYDTTLTMVGIDEYNIRGGSPVTIRLETGGGADYFVGFNRASATGPNRLNDEGDNQVTIVQVNGNNGESYSQSFLKAKLSQGQSYAITNYGGTTQTVTITATSIDISTTPGTAVVRITNGSTPSPTNAPTNPPPTNAPTNPPTNVPTFPPTPAPTNAPVPTFPPSPAPTRAPVADVSKYVCTKRQPADPTATICAEGSLAGGRCTSENVGSSCGNGGKVCWWASCPGGDGPPSPPTTPPPPSPPTGGCPACAYGDNGVCCGTCVDSGKPSGRGCF
eukprot:scaffold12204_cov111-Skeletonema_dohrnii-CCMP3373.AAC.2